MPRFLKSLLAIKRRSGLWLTACVVALVLLTSNLGGLLPSTAGQKYSARYELANTEELLSKANAIPIKLGVYIENYHDLSLQGRRFSAEGYYWLEWPEAIEKLRLKRQIAPALVTITNQIDEWNSTFLSVKSGPDKLANGNYYYQVRFSANFYIPNLNLRRSPFESITIPLTFEVLGDFALQNENAVLVADTSQNLLVGSYSAVDGYKLDSTTMVPLVRRYGSNWGLNQGDLSYSAVEVVARFKSSGLASFLTWIFPVLIVVGIVLLGPSLEGQLGDTRLSIPSTGMLTLIFMQQTYKASLPPLDYLTFLDWLYAAGYLISIATFLLFVWGSNAYQVAKGREKAATLAKINRTDTLFQICSMVFLAIVASLAWWA